MTAPGARALAAAHTLLFVPGTRPERFEKAFASGADVVILDLEDAVGPADKDVARRQVAAWLGQAGPEDAHRGAVRVNAPGTPWHEADIEALGPLGVALVVPKAEPGEPLARVAAGGAPVLALVETARGVVGATAVAETPGVIRLALGTFDLATELGVDPATRPAMDPARAALVFASACAGLPGPVDGVWGAVGDEAGLRDDTTCGRGLGLTGKLCIHPAQVAPVRDALAPSKQDLAWAREVVAADAANSAGAPLLVAGQMVDRPVVKRAHRLLSNLERN